VAYKRTDRVNELLQRELGTLISEELADPRIVFPTVTQVSTSPDLRSARVFVSVLGDDAAAKTTMRALADAKAFIRHRLGERTDLRVVPDLEFVLDRSAERATRISKLLRASGEREDDEPPPLRDAGAIEAP